MLRVEMGVGSREQDNYDGLDAECIRQLEALQGCPYDPWARAAVILETRRILDDFGLLQLELEREMELSD